VVGNDIVDLQFLEFPPYQHFRHLSRVCSPAETRMVLESPDPSLSLAVLWASKEATYKLVSKSSRTHFIPRQFALDAAELRKVNRKYELKVTNRDLEARVEITATERWVHAIATFPEGGPVRWGVRKIEQRFPCAQQVKVESEAVRLLARELLSECGDGNSKLEFVGRIPILKREVDGQKEMGISLSHHGSYVAVAIAWHSCEVSLNESFSDRFAGLISWGKMCSTFTA